MSAMLASLGRRAASLLFGGSCFLCRGAARTLLCGPCDADLPRLGADQCPRCSLAAPAGAVCGRCLAHPPAYDATAAALAYEFPADALVQSLKFRGELALAPLLGLVLAARVAGRRQPLDGPFIDIDDRERFLRQCVQGRALGFAGKMLIHPSQVELTHQGFRPPPEEVEQAARVVAAFDQAEAEGSAAIVVDGRLVDYPVAMRARRIVEAAS